MDTENESNQANRTISTGKLHALLHFHTRPINVVVFHGSQGNTRFEVGFPLRCFQRLSRPYIELEPTDHPLAVEQRKGITADRVAEFYAHYEHGQQ